MVSIEKISLKFAQLEEYLQILRDIGKISEEKFLKDKIVIGSAKYYLQVGIESCLDVANHIIATDRFRAPQDYADSFKVLDENHVVPSELSQKLRQMAKFRNRLVHLYGEIDNSYVYQIIHEDLGDMIEFRNIIIKRYKILAKGEITA